jgi:predicted CXXCH cytochrome family protein
MMKTKMRMKPVLVLSAAVVGSIGLAALADIEGSAHDFSTTSWGGGEICKPCHTPHFADADMGFLWSHEVSAQVYTLYDLSTSSPGGVDELDQFSRMCLSCHDGTVALNDFHDSGGPPVFISEDRNVARDGDLTDDHPIGITAEYPIAGNPELHAPTLTPSGTWGFGGGFFPEVPLVPFNGEQVVSCSSCHTPHAIAGIEGLLRKDNAGSELCLTCHIK